jgi:hypothetical protein
VAVSTFESGATVTKGDLARWEDTSDEAEILQDERARRIIGMTVPWFTLFMLACVVLGGGSLWAIFTGRLS